MIELFNLALMICSWITLIAGLIAILWGIFWLFAKMYDELVELLGIKRELIAYVYWKCRKNNQAEKARVAEIENELFKKE